MVNDLIIIKTEYENCDILMTDKMFIIRTKYQHLKFIGSIVGFMGIAIMMYGNTGGFILLAIGGSIAFLSVVWNVGISEVPGYELFSAFGSRIIIKTNPDQDKIAVCNAKKELEDIIKEQMTKQTTRCKEMREMVECQPQ